MKTWTWAAVILSILVAAGPVRADGRRNYRVATVAWMGWSPLHVADEKGMWSDLGLDVEVQNYDDPTVILEAIAAGRVDFAMDMIGTLVGMYMRGDPVVALAETDWSNGGDRIIIRKGSRPRDLVGGPVGVFLNQPSCLYFLGRYLETQGLAPGDFRVVEINAPDLASQFIAGRIPMIVDYEPWAGRALMTGDGEVLADSSDFRGVIPEGLWTFRQRLDTIPEQDARRIIQGWIEAVRWLHDPENRNEFFEILNRRTFAGQPPYSPDELQTMRDHVLIHTPEVMWERNRDGGGLDDYLVSLKDFLKRNSMLQRDFQPSDIYDNRIVTGLLRREYGVGGAAE